MFLDPFTFNPPSPATLTRAVESYQRVAAARFCRYARDAENPELLPARLSGLSLEPTPKQLHAEVRALRHLTAIQRTLRDIGGPLFDPASPIPPEERFRIVGRRLDAIEEALADPEDPPFESESSNLVNPVDPVSSSSSSFYHPPEIEDLLEAVNDAQRVFAARADLIDKRRLTLSPEDFLLEISALRDLTAVVRTLRRMSAHPLPEDQSADDLRHERAARVSDRPASSAPAPNGASTSDSPENSPAFQAPHAPHRSHASAALSPSEIPDPKSEIPDPPPSHASSESVKSEKSVDRASSRPEITASLRPVPRVPEVRPVGSSGNRPAPALNNRESGPPPGTPGDAPPSEHGTPGACGPAHASASDPEIPNLKSESPDSAPSPPSNPVGPSRAAREPSSGGALVFHEPHPPPPHPR